MTDPFSQNHLPPQLIARQLASDPRISQAKKLILDTVLSYQKTVIGIRPPLGALKQTYQEAIESLEKCRGNKLWFPFIGSGFGSGVFVELLDGSIKYDLINGIGPHYLGHSHPELIEACIDAAMSDTVMQGNLQQNIDALQFSETLVKASGLDHCFITTSGATANENALKICFQKRHPANRILAFEHCFAGRTWALSQITDKPGFREGLPSNVFVDYLPFFNVNDPENSTKQALKVLQEHLARHPKQYAVMLAELVQGENGFYPGSKDFFSAIFQVLKDNNISIFIDEVQTFGRTPELFAFKYYKLERFADVVSIGKLSQACATLYNKEHSPRPNLLSQTFTGSTSAIRAGLAIINHLLNGGYYGPQGKITALFDHFCANLIEIAKRHPHLVQGPYGIGAMIAFTPFNGDAKRVTQFVHELFHEGVMSFVAGSNPTRVRFLIPAGAITPTDIDNVTKIVEKVLTNTSSE